MINAAVKDRQTMVESVTSDADCRPVSSCWALSLMKMSADPPPFKNPAGLLVCDCMEPSRQKKRTKQTGLWGGNQADSLDN